MAWVEHANADAIVRNLGLQVGKGSSLCAEEAGYGRQVDARAAHELRRDAPVSAVAIRCGVQAIGPQHAGLPR